MGLSVVTNTTAMTAYRNLSVANAAMNTSLERLSSGYRINRAADDAAGLAISTGLHSQLSGIAQATRNTQDGISVLQTADGALGETTSILQRMRDLAVQAANTGALDHDARADIQTELNQLKNELTRISTSTSFNGTTLLDGSYDGLFQVGPAAGDSIEVRISGDMSAHGLGVDGLNIAADHDPSSVTAFPAQGRIPYLQTGEIVFEGATAGATGASGLSGTISYGGHSLDLGQVHYSDTDGNGVIDNSERVAQLNAAAAASGFSYRSDPFVDDGQNLIFRGEAPTADATTAELADLSPHYSLTPPDVLVVGASTSIPPQAGLLRFPGTPAAELPTLRGSVSCNGKVLDLGSVTYTDSDGDGVISTGEALAQLNTAAVAAGITSDPAAFKEVHLFSLSEDQYVDQGMSVQFFGAVPTDATPPADLPRMSPTFVPGQDMISTIDDALRTVSSLRSYLGAVQNRFEHTVAELGVASESTAASLSRIEDTDMARETANLSRSQVLLQAATAMLAQANQAPRSVLALLTS